MFCPKCGNNVPDGNAFCPQCGSPLGAGDAAQPAQQQYQQPVQQQYQQPAQQMYGQPAAAGVGVGFGQITGMLQGIPLKLVAKVAFLVAIVCFLFPFMSVSCDASAAASLAGESADDGDYKFEVVYKGYNMIFPSTISSKNVKTGSGFDDMMEEEDEDEDDDSEYGSEEKTNVWLIITVLACAAGAVILFLKHEQLFMLIATGCAGLSTLCLIIFRSTFVKRYITNGETDLEGMEDYLKVNTKFGFILCMVAVIVALIACGLTYLSTRTGTHQQQPVQQPPQPQQQFYQ